MTHSWLPEGPAAVRGTVVVLPGRGEHGGVYERFGRRLAYDAYAVHAVDAGGAAGAGAGAGADVGDRADVGDGAAALAEAVAGLAAVAQEPVVLAGSDTGALSALSLALSGTVAIGGLILVGVPGRARLAVPGDWQQELEARTACPTHRAHLAVDHDFVRGALSQPVRAKLLAVLDDPALDALAVPTLVLHGTDDQLAPASEASALADRLPGAELVLARTPSHDVLNDAIHRTVAAHVVQWLERLRGDGPARPLLAVRPATEPAAAR
ncbi:pimeloyl-ACP methyl ester carboxylesterase [Catenulispora sp. GP43]|uniref:alpha/beta hydrolase n=1 Tax=Catenulispora sp. GP43 TaxID=3156263 RepID=UPI003514D5E8